MNDKDKLEKVTCIQISPVINLTVENLDLPALNRFIIELTETARLSNQIFFKSKTLNDAE